MDDKPRISIEYCPRCGWMLRSTWLAQELLSTFERELGEIALIPSSVSGRFRISIGGALVWCRKADGGFPQAAELKRRVRDRIAPGMSLGHSDGASRRGEDPGSSEAAGDREPTE